MHTNIYLHEDLLGVDQGYHFHYEKESSTQCAGAHHLE